MRATLDVATDPWGILDGLWRYDVLELDTVYLDAPWICCHIIGDLELDETLTSRETINTKMRRALDL